MKPSNPKYTYKEVGLEEPKQTKPMKQTTKVNLIACAFILAAIILMSMFWSSCTKAKPTLQPNQVDTTTYRTIKLTAKANLATYRISLQTMSDNKTHGNKVITDTTTYLAKVIKGDSLWIVTNFIGVNVPMKCYIAFKVYNNDSVIYVDTAYSAGQRYFQVQVY